MYKLQDGEYAATTPQWLPQVELGLCLWERFYEGKQDVWLRWCAQAGNVIPTGAERAEQERQAKEAAQQRAEQLVAQLRALSIDPDEIS